MQTMNLRQIFVALACVAALGIGVRLVQSARSAARLSSLLTPGASAHQHEYDPAKEPARKERAWKLYQLWLARHERNVTAEVLPFLQDEYAILRNNAARILGRLENPAAEPHLQKLLTAVQQKGARGLVSPVSLALARNRSRGLKGRVKVAAFAQGMGLSFDEAVLLTEKVRASRSMKGRTTGERIVKEMVDMLYMMGKRGEDIEALVEHLTLHPAQQVLLQAAGLPPDEEAKLIVDYLTKLNVVTLPDVELTQLYLPSLGSHATEAVVQRLEELKEGRVQLGNGYPGWSNLFRAVEWSGDPRALALLKHFQKNGDSPWVRHYASQARRQMEHLEDWSSPFSPTPPMMQFVL